MEIRIDKESIYISEYLEALILSKASTVRVDIYAFLLGILLFNYKWKLLCYRQSVLYKAIHDCFASAFIS